MAPCLSTAIGEISTEGIVATSVMTIVGWVVVPSETNIAQIIAAAAATLAKAIPLVRSSRCD